MSEENSPQSSSANSIEPSYSIGSPSAENLEKSPLTLSEPPKESLGNRIFFGSSGLRPGWSIIVYLLVLFFVAALLGALAHKVVHHLVPSKVTAGPGAVVEQRPQTMLISEAVSFLSVALATWIMARSEQRPVGTYGFGGTLKVSQFMAGFAWGGVFLALLVGVLWKARLLAFDGRLLFGASAIRYGLIWALGFLLVGLFEEYLMRGYLQYTLSRGLASLYQILFKTPHGDALGFWTAAVILSFLFGLGHGRNPGESPIGLASAGLIGLVFCLTLWRTGSLWWALGFHASWDWAQSFLFGVADSGTMVEGHLFASHPAGKVFLSGGATGPEGSIFILPLLVLIVLVIFWTLPSKRAAI